MSQDLTVVEAVHAEVNLMAPNPAPGHVLGPVDDDWAAIEVWLSTLLQKWSTKFPEKSRSGVSQTDLTYRYHLAKLRWYCENVARITPSRWTTQDVQHFTDFLNRLPDDALCARKVVGGMEIANSYVEEGELGWTPFRKQPSNSSQSDIKRFVHAMFNAWHKTGYIRINPMALTGAGSIRKVNIDRSISLDLYELVLTQIATSPTKSFLERQMQVRDFFIFEALRGLGLRASELVNAKMTAFNQVLHPRTRKCFWIFHVTEETGKGGKARKIPVPTSVWQAFTNYREAFGLTPVPVAGDSTGLLLSPRTQNLTIGTKTIKHTGSRRFFKSWSEVGSRKGLYKIVKLRLQQSADTLRSNGDNAVATHLESASPHWLRHTFGKSKIVEGLGMRQLAGALGHASMDTTMIYTDQEALDLIDAYEAAVPGSVASERIV